MFYLQVFLPLSLVRSNEVDYVPKKQLDIIIHHTIEPSVLAEFLSQFCHHLDRLPLQSFHNFSIRTVVLILNYTLHSLV